MLELNTILIAFGVILVSMMLHELAHGFVAYKLGDDTAKTEGRLTLNPFKHLDPVLSVAMPLLLFLSGGPVFGGAKPVPVNKYRLKYGAWGMALVALAGPLTNFILALAAFLLGHFSGWLYGDGLGAEILTNVMFINMGFGVFNLIPIPPLDGSRVVYAIAPDQVRDLMEAMENWGIIIVMLLVVMAPGWLSLMMSGVMQGILDFFYLLVGVK